VSKTRDNAGAAAKKCDKRSSRAVRIREKPLVDQQNTSRDNAIVVNDTGKGKFQVRACTSSGEFLIDEPLNVGGLGSGPNPYDLLRAALGACTVMTMRLYANRKNFPLDHASVSVYHFRDARGRDIFVRELSLDGALDDDQIQKIVGIAERCPVHLTLTRGADVQTSLRSDAAATRPAEPHEQCDHSKAIEEACRQAEDR
jgi:putative redox protein